MIKDLFYARTFGIMAKIDSLKAKGFTLQKKSSVSFTTISISREKERGSFTINDELNVISTKGNVNLIVDFLNEIVSKPDNLVIINVLKQLLLDNNICKKLTKENSIDFGNLKQIINILSEVLTVKEIVILLKNDFSSIFSNE